MRQSNVALISMELKDEVERGLLRRRSSRLTITAGIPALSSSCFAVGGLTRLSCRYS